ncbi:hypothetical protein AHAS_Ahas20G0085000 [Arachis hypogaea]
MKGVGKTALMQNLNNHDVVAEIFDIVIFISLSADHTDHELQCKIAKRLKVDTEVINDPEEVARIIHEELQTKKYLLILDGAADEINLGQLGIPCNDNHSKVIITAQHRQVCTLNGAERMIEVGLLSRDEAWKMFCNTVGPVIGLPDIPEIARRVCDKCSCLPLLIQKIARSFRLKKSASSWRVGLEDLEERWPDYENEGVSELYSFLTFCYDELKDENKQKCFLYASLYPANCKVYTDYLVECWAAQNFLGDINNTRKYQKARDRGQAILEHLTDVSLLDRGKQMIYVSMNDCMQQLALHISSKHPECSSYVQTREKLDDAQESLSWEKARWVSMIDTNLKNLPTNQDCSMLLMLLLQKNPDLSTIPQLFFKKHMRSLLVLDLYGTGIRWLPSSMSKLTGLKGLYLNHCKHLRQLPPAIGTLVLLEFLDIQGTQISFIPSLIGSLISLRCLRVPYIRNGEQNGDQTSDLDPRAISRLTKLEELVIKVVSYEDWCSNAENVMAMLASLEHLTNLQCSFPSSEILDRFLRRRSGRQFTSFQFFVGCPNSKQPQILEPFEYRICKYIRYDNSKHENTFSVSEILPQTHAVELVHFNDIEEISEVGKENLEQIRENSNFVVFFSVPTSVSLTWQAGRPPSVTSGRVSVPFILSEAPLISDLPLSICHFRVGNCLNLIGDRRKEMPRDLSRSRSPPHRRRHSPSPVGHRHSRRSRKDRSRSPYSSYSHSRRKSRSISPRGHRSRSPTPRRHRSRSPATKRYRRHRSRSSSLSPVHKSSSSSLGSIEQKNVVDKQRKEEEKKRRQQEAELKLIEEETAKRVEEAIHKRVEESLNSEEVQVEIQRRLEEGRKRLNVEVTAQLEKEKEAAVIEAKRKEEQARKEKEELERILEENKRKTEEAQRREALEQQRREEERYRELEELQRQKEEAMRRKKQEEEQERLNQIKLLGKNKSRPKLSFALGSK